MFGLLGDQAQFSPRDMARRRCPDGAGGVGDGRLPVTGRRRRVAGAKAGYLGVMAGRVMIGLNRHHPLERMGGGGDVVAMVEEKAQSKDHTDAGRREHQCAAT